VAVQSLISSLDIDPNIALTVEEYLSIDQDALVTTMPSDLEIVEEVNARIDPCNNLNSSVAIDDSEGENDAQVERMSAREGRVMLEGSLRWKMMRIRVRISCVNCVN
jgi:hypothetical protein